MKKCVPFTSPNVADTVHTSLMNIVHVKFVLYEHLTITTSLSLYLDKCTIAKI